MLTMTSASGTTICGSSSRGVTSRAARPISTETMIRMIEKLVSRKLVDDPVEEVVLLGLGGRGPCCVCWLMTVPPRLGGRLRARRRARPPSVRRGPRGPRRASGRAARRGGERVPSSTTSTSSSWPTRRTASGRHDEHLLILQRDEDPAEHAAVDVGRAGAGDLHLERPALGLGLGHDLADRGVAIVIQGIDARAAMVRSARAVHARPPPCPRPPPCARLIPLPPPASGGAARPRRSGRSRCSPSRRRSRAEGRPIPAGAGSRSRRPGAAPEAGTGGPAATGRR